MAKLQEIPEGVDENYENAAAREALVAFQASPDYEHLARFLNALREGYLVVDVTGTAGQKKGPRVRTIRSTKGQLVLPLFTSMAELRALAPTAGAAELKGAIMPAHSALALITADRFVAAEFDKASAGLVCLRKFIELVLGDAEITAESLQA
ncbi:SseB family protein [Leucobacter albus]|uniref:SseB family protein n=1 Tax=Leucobacter albus TaxID=272210 RepID=A0ABW3TLL1_9MICO